MSLTLTDTSGPLTYSAGPFLAANPTPILEVDSGPECANPVQPCDDYALTVTLPAGYKALHPNALIILTRVVDPPARPMHELTRGGQ